MRFIAATLCLGFSLALSAEAQSPKSMAGVWVIEAREEALKPLGGGAVPLNAAGLAQYTANKAVVAEMTSKPTERNDLRRCLPLGPTRILEEPFPLQVIETASEVILIWEHNHTYENVFLGQKPDPDEDWAYMGNSVGQRKNDVLIVDSQGFNDQTYLDNTGLPHSDQLKVRREFSIGPDGKTLNITTTITDPAVFTKPWKVKHQLKLAPSEQLQEYVCGQGPILETRYTRAAAKKP